MAKIANVVSMHLGYKLFDYRFSSSVDWFIDFIHWFDCLIDHLIDWLFDSIDWFDFIDRTISWLILSLGWLILGPVHIVPYIVLRMNGAHGVNGVYDVHGVYGVYDERSVCLWCHWCRWCQMIDKDVCWNDWLLHTASLNCRMTKNCHFQCAPNGQNGGLSS